MGLFLLWPNRSEPGAGEALRRLAEGPWNTGTVMPGQALGGGGDEEAKR